jgi:surface polysaccharide O-acyltransferase-like enzyme
MVELLRSAFGNNSSHPSTLRFNAVDWLRFLALIEIAAFHSLQGRIPYIDGLGLPTLLLTTSIWNYKVSVDRGSKKFLQAKSQRLLIPWLFWSVVFGFIVTIEALRNGSSIGVIFSFSRFIAGTYPHLWFVPFAFFGSLVVVALQKSTKQLPTSGVVVVSCAIGFGMLAMDPSNYLDAWGSIGPQWEFALPSIFFGLAIGRALFLPNNRNRTVYLSGIACAAIIFWALASWLNAPIIWHRYMLSILIVLLALNLHIKRDWYITLLAPLTLGIYLTTPLIIRIFMTIHLSIGNSLTWALASTALAGFLVWIIRRTPMKIMV